MPASNDEALKRCRESEEKYRKMFERANDGLFAVDTQNGKIIEVNPKAEEMTGYTSGELVGMPVRNLHPQDEWEAAERLFQEVSSTGEGMCTDLHLLKKDGGTLDIDISASVIKYGDKTVIQRICRDVTQRRDLERQGDALRRYYEFILDMMPVGLGVKKNVNTDPSVEFENKRLREIFPPDPADPSHRGWLDPPDSDVPVKATIDDTGVYAEERYYPDGRVYQFTLSYYRNDENAWSELQLVRDVTLRRQLEDRLQEALEDLEQKVEERTKELRDKHAQLVQAEKMVALGGLVAGVAHEINTPLGALKSNNDLLIRSIRRLQTLVSADDIPESVRTNPGLTKLMDNIDDINSVNKTAMERIVKIVRSLRQFARLDEAERDRVDVHNGLESTLTLVHHELKNRIQVHKEYGNLPAIYIYPNQINQVFMNLLVNASQAIEGKGDIYIKTYARDDVVVVEFRDTGKGIPQENLERIFDPGFTTKGSGVGTGLGLSICYQIIREHEGNIEFESEVGKGTTVRMSLPIR